MTRAAKTKRIQAAAIKVAEVASACALDTWECHFCDYDGDALHPQPHDKQCPLAKYEAAKRVRVRSTT